MIAVNCHRVRLGITAPTTIPTIRQELPEKRTEGSVSPEARRDAEVPGTNGATGHLAD